jgi:hypothetical protein
MKTGLQKVIHLNPVSLPVGGVGNFQLNFVPTSPVSRCLLLCEQNYRRFIYIQMDTVQTISRFFTLSLSQTDGQTDKHTIQVQAQLILRCHRLLASELEINFFAVSLAWWSANIILEDSPLVIFGTKSLVTDVFHGTQNLLTASFFELSANCQRCFGETKELGRKEFFITESRTSHPHIQASISQSVCL